MSRVEHQDIRIGTLASMAGAADYVKQIVGYGFESFELTNWRVLPEGDLGELARTVRGEIDGLATVSSVGVYGNPLQEEVTAEAFATLIRRCRDFGCDTVCGFAGAVEGKPVPESLEQFRKVFGELAKIAEGEGVRIAFENCDMGGSWDSPKWNIAHSPRAWEMMFDTVPSEALGLEWEPCHQMVSFIDPLPQLKKWVGRIYHIHGKDATVDWDAVRTKGIRGGEYVVWHRTPGFGDTNWTDLISILRQHGWRGSIDIEGWHDPVYKDDLEMTGQVAGLEYLKRCRGGAYVPNPSAG